ncbi:hypothetical protein D3C77_462750 [compost metagenome]
MHAYGQRLQQGPLLKAHLVRQLEQKVAAHGYVFRPCSIHRRSGHEDDVRAKIITPRFTIFAATASHSRLYGNPVTYRDVVDLRPDLDHFPGQLVAENDWLLYDIAADPPMLIIMDIRATDSDAVYFHQGFILFDAWNGHLFDFDIHRFIQYGCIHHIWYIVRHSQISLSLKIVPIHFCIKQSFYDLCFAYPSQPSSMQLLIQLTVREIIEIGIQLTAAQILGAHADKSPGKALVECDAILNQLRILIRKLGRIQFPADREPLFPVSGIIETQRLPADNCFHVTALPAFDRDRSLQRLVIDAAVSQHDA